MKKMKNVYDSRPNAAAPPFGKLKGEAVMMEKYPLEILEQILVPNDPEYAPAVKKLYAEIEYFTEKLAPEDAERFAALVGLHEEIHAMETDALLELHQEVRRLWRL